MKSPSNSTSTDKKKRNRKNSYFSHSFDFFCPSAQEVLKDVKSQKDLDKSGYYKLIRHNVKDFASRPSISYRKPSITPRLRASEFSAAIPEHVKMVKQLGITVIVLKDGRVQLIHNAATAHSLEYAEEGAFFMQEMISLSKQQAAPEEPRLRTVSFTLPSSVDANQVNISLLGGPAQFGIDIATLERPIEGFIVRADPIDACVLENIQNRRQFGGRIVLAQRGNCMFIEKARNAQRMGAIGIIVFDNAENSSSKTMPMFAMSGDGSSDVTIPAVFLYTQDATILTNAIDEHGNDELKVRLDALHEDTPESSSVDNEMLAQLFEQANKEATKESSKPKGGSMLDMSSIFDVLKSNKLKFDLLSSLNLKEIKDENVNLIMSLLSKLALTKDSSLAEKTVHPVGPIVHSHQSLHAQRHCWNPQVNLAAFHRYLIAPYSVCLA